MSEHRYGCHNRPRPVAGSSYLAQSGWSEPIYDGFGQPHRTPIYTEIIGTFGTTLCQYDKAATDPSCAGCAHGRRP